MNTTETRQQIIERLTRAAVEQLGEHGDAVQVLVTWNEDALTKVYARGGGNWYARLAMAREFCERSQAQTAAQEVAEALQPPADD
jgi:phenylpyruvate tautomerase PptA (4-oxalocrotonate tautomerase family)